jgi:hypothetical protein
MDWCWKRDQLKLLLFKSSLLISISSFTWLLPNILPQIVYNLRNIADVCMVNIGKASCHREGRRTKREGREVAINTVLAEEKGEIGVGGFEPIPATAGKA